MITHKARKSTIILLACLALAGCGRAEAGAGTTQAPGSSMQNPTTPVAVIEAYVGLEADGQCAETGGLVLDKDALERIECGQSRYRITKVLSTYPLEEDLDLPYAPGKRIAVATEQELLDGPVAAQEKTRSWTYWLVKTDEGQWRIFDAGNG